MGQSPGWSYNFVPTAGQWNYWFGLKQDDLGLSLSTIVALENGVGIAGGIQAMMPWGTFTLVTGGSGMQTTPVAVAGLLATSRFKWWPASGANSNLAANMMPYLSPISQVTGLITFQHPATTSTVVFQYEVSL